MSYAGRGILVYDYDLPIGSFICAAEYACLRIHWPCEPLRVVTYSCLNLRAHFYVLLMNE